MLNFGVFLDPRVINNFRTIIMNLTFELREFPLVVIATTHKPTAVSQDLHEAFLHEIKMEVIQFYLFTYSLIFCSVNNKS